MQEQELKQGFDSLNREINFIPDSEPAYLVKISPDDYRTLIQSGYYRGLFAKIYFSYYGIGGLDYSYVYEQHKVLNKSMEKRSEEVVRYPNPMNCGRTERFNWMVEQTWRVEQKRYRLLPNYPTSSLEEKTQVAKVYWNTAANFPQVWETDPSEATTAQEYFIEKLREWTKIGEHRVPEITKRRRAIEKGILNNIESLLMFWFFRLFQNTDIVLVDNCGYMLDLHPAFKPNYFGIACWLWGWSLYWSINNNLNQFEILNEWEWEFDSWINIFFGVQLEIARIGTENLPVFEENYFRFRKLVWANFLERVYATLCVDISLRRSPFNDINNDQIRSIQAFWLSILNNILFKLGVS